MRDHLRHLHNFLMVRHGAMAAEASRRKRGVSTSSIQHYNSPVLTPCVSHRASYLYLVPSECGQGAEQHRGQFLVTEVI